MAGAGVLGRWSVIVGIGTSLFSQFTQTFGGAPPTFEQARSVLLAALAMLGLGIFGPGILAEKVLGDIFASGVKVLVLGRRRAQVLAFGVEQPWVAGENCVSRAQIGGS